MPLFRFTGSALLLVSILASVSVAAQTLTLKSHILKTIPANLAEHLNAATEKQDARLIVIDRTLFQQKDWQQQLSRIELQLDDATAVTVLPKQLSVKTDSVIWQGYISGAPNSLVAMVISTKGISGSVRHKGRLWQIRRLADGQVIMYETSPQLINADDSIKLSSTQLKQQSILAQQQSTSVLLPTVVENAAGFTDETRLQVMVYYDIQELETYPDLLELIDLEFQQANSALLNSGIDAQLNAVVKLPVSRQNASRGMLSLMLSGEDMFSNLARDRQRYSADLVHYFGLNIDQWACGLAYLSAFPSGEAYADWGLGVTHSSCLGSLVFAHEIGHNFGAEHDRYVEPEADHDYNYGYVDLETASKTIMAYSNLCDDNGKSCEQLPYFSNPALEHQNRPLGIAAGEPEAADNRQMLNFSAVTLANYAGIGAPTGLTASNNNLRQGINVNWQPFPGASEYELYRSSSCDYDSFKTLLITTTDTSYADVDVAGGRYCYFVQAVNNNLLTSAQHSPLSLPESGFGSGPALDKIADQYTDSVDQSIAVTFSSGTVVAPSVEIVQHNLKSEPLLFLKDLGANQFQLTVSNSADSDGTAIVKVTTDKVFEVFSVSFSGNVNTVPVITAPEQVTFNQQNSTSFDVDIIDSQIAATNPIGILLQTEDYLLIPEAALDYSLSYTETGALLSIEINPQHKLFGTTALNIQITDGEHLVSQRIEVDIVRVLNSLPQVPANSTMYLDGNKPLQRLLPVYDADNDIMEFTLLSDPTQGQLTISGNAFNYLPDAGFSGEDSFSYRVTELYSGESFDSTVVITNLSKHYLLPKQKLVSSINSAQFLLDFSGQLWAWGSNEWQLFGTEQTQPIPSALFNNLWSDIGISDNNIMLIHQDGSLWQLGWNWFTSSNKTAPARIGNDNDWLAIIDASYGNVYCYLLIKADHSLWASGLCRELQDEGVIAADGLTSSIQQPVQISALYHWVNGKHNQTTTALIDTQGKVWTRGPSRNIGRDTEIAFLAPVDSLSSTVKSVHPMNLNTFALTEHGLFAWGSLPTNAPWQWDQFGNNIYANATALDSPRIAQLSANGAFLLMLDEENELWTAGGFTNQTSPGALGRGDSAERGLAIVDFDDKWRQIFSADDVSYGLTENGHLVVAGQYDLTLGLRTLEPSEQIHTFSSIAQFDLKQLGYTDTDADGMLDYLETDADNDGLPDGWELLYGLDRQNAADAALDNDNDGLSNLQEFELGTNPTKADSDDDTMPDAWELEFGFDPNDAGDAALDTDNDQLSNAAEFQRGTLPNNADTDADGMPDGWEVQYNFNPLNAADASLDSDNDGLTNLQEYQLGTNPIAADTDGDTMTDGWEVQYSFNPLNGADGSLDSDNDGLTNAAEFQHGTLPNNPDTDADGMPDGWEIQYGLNPLDPADATSDKDNDDITSLQEYKNGTNPNVSDKVTPPPPPAPPAETSSSGGSMPITAIVALLLLVWRRKKLH